MSETTPETSELRERLAKVICGALCYHDSVDGYRHCLTQANALLPVVAQEIAAAEQRERARVEDLAVSMSGVGAHRPPCRLPDTPCLCGVCDFRAEAAALVRAALAEPAQEEHQ